MNTNAKKRNSGVVDGVMDYIGEAFDTGVNAARGIHQAGAEIPLNILQSLGLPEDTAKSLKEKHEGLITSVYDAVHSVVSEVGKAGAGQIRLVQETVLDEKTSGRKTASRASQKPRRKSRAKAAR